jgi:hypothetical protein
VKRWPIALAVLLALAVGGWVWGSPYWTVSRLKTAVAARDLGAISAKVDYPAVRESLKAQLRAQLGRSETSGLEGLGAALAQRFADPLVDAAVTPEGMRSILAGAALAQAQPAGQPQAPPVRMQLRREALGRFVLAPENGEGPTVVFELQGLEWRVTGVRLPAHGLI